MIYLASLSLVLVNVVFFTCLTFSIQRLFHSYQTPYYIFLLLITDNYKKELHYLLDIGVNFYIMVRNFDKLAFQFCYH